ncbi:MAG: hypothetical protein R2788_26070 [Saprospiraceae bacterium]
MFAKPHNISIDSVTITASGQVTIVMPKNYDWDILHQSLGFGLGVGEVIGPIENPDVRDLSVGLVTAEPTHPIALVNNEETLLFMITDGTCPEFMHLIECGSPNGSDPFALKTR